MSKIPQGRSTCSLVKIQLINYCYDTIILIKCPSLQIWKKNTPNLPLPPYILSSIRDSSKNLQLTLKSHQQTGGNTAVRWHRFTFTLILLYAIFGFALQVCTD